MPNKGYFIQQITRRGAGTCDMATGKKDIAVIFSVNKKIACRRTRRARWWRWTRPYGQADKIVLLLDLVLLVCAKGADSQAKDAAEHLKEKYREFHSTSRM